MKLNRLTFTAILAAVYCWVLVGAACSIHDVLKVQNASGLVKGAVIVTVVAATIWITPKVLPHLHYLVRWCRITRKRRARRV
jgi:membrane protein YdbS with pleckstrin-like domain